MYLKVFVKTVFRGAQRGRQCYSQGTYMYLNQMTLIIRIGYKGYIHQYK